MKVPRNGSADRANREQKGGRDKWPNNEWKLVSVGGEGEVYLDSGRARVTGPRLRRTASRDSRTGSLGHSGAEPGAFMRICIRCDPDTGVRARVRVSTFVLRPGTVAPEEARRKIRPAFPGECVSIPSGLLNLFYRVVERSFSASAFHARATGTRLCLARRSIEVWESGRS